MTDILLGGLFGCGFSYFMGFSVSMKMVEQH